MLSGVGVQPVSMVPHIRNGINGHTFSGRYKSVTCRYCDGGISLIAYAGAFNVYISGSELKAAMRHTEGGICQIKYCPMCGKDLLGR